MTQSKAKSSDEEEPECRRASFNGGATEAVSRPVLRLEPELYAEHVAELGLPADQQQELFETLWNIMVAFVDLGWSVDKIDPIFEHIFAAGGEIRHSEGGISHNKNSNEESYE